MNAKKRHEHREVGGWLKSPRLLAVVALFALAAIGFVAWQAHLFGARPVDLVEVPQPAIEGLSPEDRQEIDDQLAAVERAAAAGEDTTQASAFGRLGQLYLAFDFVDAAEAALTNAARLDADEPAWVYLRAMAIQQSGRLEEAASALEEVLEDHPDLTPAKVRLAEVYLDLGRREEADRILQEVLSEDQDNALASYLMGLIALEREEYGAAVERLEQALALQPNATTLYSPLAQAHRALGNNEAADAALAQRGAGRVTLGDPFMAEVVGLRQRAEAMLNQGGMLMQQGRYEEAAQVFANAVEADPESGEAHIHLAGVLAELGELDRAVGQLDIALELDPDSLHGHLAMAMTQDRRGDSAVALEHVQRARELDPNSPEALQLSGVLLRKLGRCSDAIEPLERYLQADPSNFHTRLNLALCLTALGRDVQAVETLEAGLEASPDHPAFKGALVRVLAASQDPGARNPARAATLSDELLETSRTVDALEVAAMAAAADGDFRTALAHQEAAIELARSQPERGPYLDWMTSQLEAYQSGEAPRHPWPPQVLESGEP